jgi:hypothetical protein
MRRENLKRFAVLPWFSRELLRKGAVELLPSWKHARQARGVH